jgi:hypothetical protein
MPFGQQSPMHFGLVETPGSAKNGTPSMKRRALETVLFLLKTFPHPRARP